MIAFVPLSLFFLYFILYSFLPKFVPNPPHFLAKYLFKTDARPVIAI